MSLLTRIAWVLFVVGIVALVLSFVIGGGLLGTALSLIRWALALAVVLAIVQLVLSLLGTAPPP